MPWARSFWAFSPYLNHMRNFSKKKKITRTNSNCPCYFFSLRFVLSLTSLTFPLFWNFNYLIMRLLSLLLSVVDWRNVYEIHHAIPHDLGLSITFFWWTLCRRCWIRLRVKQNFLPMGRKLDWDVSVCFTGWNKVFLRLNQTVSWYETKYFMPWNRNLCISLPPSGLAKVQ